MSGDHIKTFKLEVEIQENGIIRDPFGWIIGRCDDDWLRLVTRHESVNRHAYEQCITGDGSDWGEIMIDAFDNLMANACESCTSDQMARLTSYIQGELWHGSATR